MFDILAQLPGADIAKEAISKTDSDLGLIFLCFGAGCFLLTGLGSRWYFQNVIKPEKEASRENAKQLVENQKQLTAAVADLVPLQIASNAMSEKTHRHVEAIHRTMKASVKALQKINDCKDVPPDLAAEIGEMKGALGDLEE